MREVYNRMLALFFVYHFHMYSSGKKSIVGISKIGVAKDVVDTSPTAHHSFLRF